MVKKRVLSIYHCLHQAYGPQKWWPITLEGDTHPSYNGKKALSDKQRFEIAVGAMLTQNTNWNNVEKAIASLTKQMILEPQKIVNESNSIIEKAIRPSGYYKLKTERLKSLAKWWIKNDSIIMPQEKTLENLKHWRESILSVKGVGQETADSILLYCYNFPTFVIDTYTKRIANRHLGTQLEIKYDNLRKLFMDNLPLDTELYKEYHALLVILAKKACKKDECLPECPLRQSAKS